MSEQWNGEGLPPAGTVCEFNASLYGWTRTEITAIGRDHICFVVDGIVPEQVLPHRVEKRFRPIRTPEQIAADELREVLLKTHMPTGYVIEVTAAVLKAGYRKVEGAKE